MRVGINSRQVGNFKADDKMHVSYLGHLKSRSDNDFSNLLSSKVNISFRKEIQSIISYLDYYSDKLVSSFSVNNLLYYKKYVKSFLRLIQKNSYLVRKIYGRNLDYKIISVVNRKLEDLANDVVNDEFSNLDLIDKLDEIRGLIIDLIS